MKLNYEELEAKCAALAAENAGLKSIQEWAVAGVFRSGAKEFESTKAAGFDTDDCLHDAVLVMLSELKTPATDAFLAEVRAQAHKEGAHFVANRMLAAWEAGFIDDTAKNAADIARMILTSTEFMADAPEGDF
ncbi:TPA: Eae-like protein, partial [Enterobacter hormaechei]